MRLCIRRSENQSKVEQIQRGVSTREDVRKLIGSLDSMTKDSDRREIWTYFYSSATSKPESFIPIVGAFAGGVNMRTQHTMIFFGEDGKVERYTSSTGGTDVGTGLNAAGEDKASMRPVQDGKRAK